MNSPYKMLKNIIYFPLLFSVVFPFAVSAEIKVFKDKNGLEYRYDTVAKTLKVPIYYVDHGDGTVTDERTGLMWQQKDDGKKYEHRGAINYCKNLSYADYNDWRLPDIDELKSLLTKGKNSEGRYIDKDFFPNTRWWYYWSSSVHASNADGAWDVDFSDGNVGWGSRTSGRHVRCVRSG